MPVTITIDGPIFHSEFSDPFTFAEFTTACREAMKRPEFTPPMRSLIDVRRVKRSLPMKEINDMAEYSASLKDSFSRRCAIVCEPHTLVFGLSRMFCSLAELYGLDFTMFGNFYEARAWLLKVSSTDSV